MSADPYNALVRALFANPGHSGLVDGGVEAYIEDQGVRVCLSMACSAGTIGEIRFQAWGCPHLLAACEAACADFEGRPGGDLAHFSAAGLMQKLGIPVEKTGRILVLEDTIRLLEDAVREISTLDH